MLRLQIFLVLSGVFFMDRRAFLGLGLSLPFAGITCALAADPIYIGDMHFHSFFGPADPHSRPVAKTMSDGQATLIAWKQVGDGQWIEPYERGIRQKGTPQPGEAMRRFQRQIGQIKAHVAEEKLKVVRSGADVDLALKGDPHVVLASEGATYVDDVAHVQVAYDAGIRHLQIVHYIRNPIGDYQTDKPEHNGLTELGKKVIQECNRLGILVDLAHCTPDAVKTALAVSKAPMVWSHSSIAASGTKPTFSMVGWRARQLTLDDAKAITRAGGVVGLWALKLDVGTTVEGYAQRLIDMAGQLGEDHVGFGTDINGLGQYAMMSNYVDVRRVIETWQKQKVPEKRIRKIAIENYARLLKAALQPVRA
jgi:membrane dipeptidase